MRFSSSELELLRRGIMARGQLLATLLADVMAGKQPRELAGLLADKPGARPEEVLKLALERVELRRALLDRGDDRYGRCDHCGVDLGLVSLTEMPWADRCARHVDSVST